MKAIKVIPTNPKDMAALAIAMLLSKVVPDQEAEQYATSIKEELNLSKFIVETESLFDDEVDSFKYQLALAKGFTN